MYNGWLQVVIYFNSVPTHPGQHNARTQACIHTKTRHEKLRCNKSETDLISAWHLYAFSMNLASFATAKAKIHQIMLESPHAHWYCKMQFLCVTERNRRSWGPLLTAFPLNYTKWFLIKHANLNTKQKQNTDDRISAWYRKINKARRVNNCYIHGFIPHLTFFEETPYRAGCGIVIARQGQKVHIKIRL